MRISFDLDDTLILHGSEHRPEPDRVPLVLRAIFREPVRMGTERLVRQLEEMGVDICIYTTSARPLWYIRRLLKFYGVRPSLIVNQAIHDRAIANLAIKGPKPTKIPTLFGIDLHVDDSLGVSMEGKRFHFQVLVVNPDDENWDERVIEAVLAHEFSV